MANSALNFIDYVRAAFRWRVRVPGLGHLPLNILAVAGFAILGFGNPAFWLLGLAGEVAYLLWLAGSERFQKLVQGTQILRQRALWQARQDNIYANLDGTSQGRYRRLLQDCALILKNTETLAVKPGSEDLRSGGLNQLIWLFLKLLYSKIKIRDITEQVSRGELEADIAKLSAKLSRESENTAIFRSLQGTLEIEKKRLENLVKADDSLTVIDAELDRIEKQVTLLREEASIASDPDTVSVRLDGVMQSLQGTNKWIAEHNELFGGLDESEMPRNLLEASLKQREG
ncbi:MAG: hypothetical protein MUF78_02790 [Candidatus Edwardsbacteria bacterium]|jgi:hypothetical protein|nr:hypothetical protein [Candidatus Edwardsbacteria bacterium]